MPSDRIGSAREPKQQHAITGLVMGNDLLVAIDDVVVDASSDGAFKNRLDPAEKSAPLSRSQAGVVKGHLVLRANW